MESNKEISNFVENETNDRLICYYLTVFVECNINHARTVNMLFGIYPKGHDLDVKHWNLQQIEQMYRSEFHI